MENPDSLKTTMNTRIKTTCVRLLSEVENNHTRMKAAYGKLFTPAEETKKSRRKSELSKSEPLSGNATKCLNLITGYMDSLEILKNKHTKNFIESIRNELEILWDNCSYGEKQRNTFITFYSDMFTEDVLAEHENELSVLKQHYNNNKDLFKLVLKREKLWEEKINFENPPDGCSRFENRGGTLIKELKRYQIVEKQLPITEKEIRSKVKVWERKHKNIFLIKDSQYINYIDSQKVEYKDQQEMKRKTKRLAKQEELAQEMSHSTNIATKRTSIYDNTFSKTTYKEVSEEALKELMKPTESSTLRSRMPLKSCATYGEGLSKLSKLQLSAIKDIPLAKSRLPLKSCGTPREELSSKLTKMDISSVQRSPLLETLNDKTIPSRTSYKVLSGENLREIMKPTESSLLKSRLPLRNSKNENGNKRKGSLQTEARKRKLKRRSVRLIEKNRYLKENNFIEESYSYDNVVNA